MPIVVEVVSAQDFADWAAKRKTASGVNAATATVAAAGGGDGKAAKAAQ
jgi:heme/copper-type cytochrome/quinol oxidase subunit 2